MRTPAAPGATCTCAYYICRQLHEGSRLQTDAAADPVPEADTEPDSQFSCAVQWVPGDAEPEAEDVPLAVHLACLGLGCDAEAAIHHAMWGTPDPAVLSLAAWGGAGPAGGTDELAYDTDDGFD